MNITIIGANGQVPKELSGILHQWGHTITGVVRNPFGAAHFVLRQLPYVISDVTADDQAREALQQADLVVLAAVARGDAHTAIAINRRILEGTLKHVQSGTPVVFFSSIRVLSRQVDQQLGRLDPLPAYDREKQASEIHFAASCEQYGLRGRVLRLGHVIGSNQAKVGKFREAAQGNSRFYADGDAPSNTVHTLTIAEALVRCAEDERRFLCATLVNQPQWSWREVFAYASPETENRFLGPGSARKSRRNPIGQILVLLRPLKKWLKQSKRHLRGSLGYTVYLEGRRAEMTRDLARLQPAAIDLSEFHYRPAPGPFLEKLTPTRELLQKFPNA